MMNDSILPKKRRLEQHAGTDDPKTKAANQTESAQAQEDGDPTTATSRLLLFGSDMDFHRVKRPGQAAYWVLGSYQVNNYNYKSREEENHNDRELLRATEHQDGSAPASTDYKVQATAATTADDVIIDWIIAFQPNRNARTNGVRLIILEKSTQQKLAHVLLTTSETAPPEANTTTTATTTTTSSLLGMYVDPRDRKKGWTKHVLAIWLELCSLAQLRPQTERIRKPLLSLVLQHTFGFQPVLGGGGANVDVYPAAAATAVVASTSTRADATAKILIYSAQCKILQGAFSRRCVQREGISLCAVKPQQGSGRTIYLNGRLVGPPEVVVPVAPGDDEDTSSPCATRKSSMLVTGGQFSHCLDMEQSRQILIGGWST